MMPGAGVLWGAGGVSAGGGLSSHPNLRNLQGAFGSFDLPLVAEHHGHGVSSPDLHLRGFRGHGPGAPWTLLHQLHLGKGAFNLN